MSEFFTVTLNEQNVLEYPRGQRLPGKQRDFLQQMDQDMTAGIKLGSATYTDPDEFTRVQYVTMHLIRACETDNQHMQDAMCAYLTTRSPNLEKIIATKKDNDVNVEFIFADNEEARNE